MEVSTLIDNGKESFICDDCNSIIRVDFPETKCNDCGAWYELTIKKTVPGVVE